MNRNGDAESHEYADCPTCREVLLRLSGRRVLHLVDYQPPGIQCSRCVYRAAGLAELEQHGAAAHGVGLSGRALVECRQCAARYDAAGAADVYRSSACQDEAEATLSQNESRLAGAAERRAARIVGELFGLPDEDEN